MKKSMSVRGPASGALVAMGALVGALAGCGGGGGGGDDDHANGGGTATALSANQQAFESLVLGGGSHQLLLNLAVSGAQVPGSHYAWSDSASLTSSPLTSGPQTNSQSAPANLASTLPVRIPVPLRVLKNGTVLVVPATQGFHVTTYRGADIQVDSLAADNTTVAYSVLRTNYTSVDLADAVINLPPEDLLQTYRALFANPAVLKPGTYAPGAKYIKFTSTSVGDRYNAFDCFAATTGANPSPCVTQSTLTAALTSGIASNSDARTYRLADGQLSIIDGIPVWVASAPRPPSSLLGSATEYRIYFQLNNNVYTGSLIKDGTAIGNSALPFQIRLNKAARDSLASAFAI
jgi:hypothetical protein